MSQQQINQIRRSFSTTQTPDSVITHTNEDKSFEEAATDLGAIIQEIEHEKKHHVEHTQKLASLKELAKLQETIALRILDQSILKTSKPKRPNLKIVK